MDGWMGGWMDGCVFVIVVDDVLNSPIAVVSMRFCVVVMLVMRMLCVNV